MKWLLLMVRFCGVIWGAFVVLSLCALIFRDLPFHLQPADYLPFARELLTHFAPLMFLGIMLLLPWHYLSRTRFWRPLFAAFVLIVFWNLGLIVWNHMHYHLDLDRNSIVGWLVIPLMLVVQLLAVLIRKRMGGGGLFPFRSLTSEQG
ncbi:MAG: hypothetical protein K8R23_13930 [Chthoniobacter sp.]|nr:hypothetical protein [Chthoniobacter sp.]